MTPEELQAIVEQIESIKFLPAERDLDSQALQVELAGLPPTPKNPVLNEVEGAGIPNSTLSVEREFILSLPKGC